MGRGVEPGPSRCDGPTVITGQCNSFIGINNNFDTTWNMAQDSTKINKLRDNGENNLSATRKCVIDNILQQIIQLSDLEKFLLYIKLPIGRSPEPDPLKQPLNPLGSRSEVQLTITWIKAHLEEDLDVSLFKEDVYRKYLQYSQNYNIKSLSKADFGKVMKQVFPKVKARRLGHRGDSRYTYSGLTNKFSVEPPILPDLSDSSVNDDKTSKKMPGLNTMVDSNQEKAANSIILEWAEKMCSLKCSTVPELARQLLNKSYVDTNSLSASTLMSEQGSIDVSLGKHQLQRKLQEKENKRKLQQEITIEPNRTTCERQKSRRRSGLGKVSVLDDTLTSKNIKNCQTSQLQLNHNNNLEEFVTTDNNLERLLGVTPIIKKEIYVTNDNKNSNTALCSIVGTSICALKDAGKHFVSKVSSVGVEKKVIPDEDRNNSCRSIDITNGNLSQGVGSNLPCHIEDLSPFSGDVHFIPAQANDKCSSNINSAGEKEEFISPQISGNDDKINQIRKMLCEKKIGQPGSQLLMDEPSLDYEHDISSSGLRRRVSFQSPDGSLVNPTTIIGSVNQEHPVLPTGLLSLASYTPISYIANDSVVGQVISHGSSTNTTPFMSPSTTPIQRSRHNSGQTNSTRSTPFTPDLIGQSEYGTPFMSPAPTPICRSRHNSQNIRAPFPSTSKSRHSSGTASCRHTPYQDDFSRRKSRHQSGTMHPSSAPLSPRVPDITFNTLTDLSCHSSVEPFEAVFRKGNVGIIGNFHDPRKRHVSAGPTVTYQPQPSPATFSNCSTNTDSLSLEVSNTMSNPQQELFTQGNSVNRPQSVPLLQMNTVSIPESSFVAKSYPSTPIINHQFDFSQDLTHQISFTSKGVVNFTDYSNTGIDFVEENIDQNSGNNLAAINPSISTLNNSSTLENYSQTLSNSNITFPDNFHQENGNTFNREENSANFLQNVEGATFTSNPLVSNNMSGCSHQAPNRSNGAENPCQQVPIQNQDLGFSSNSHITLNALNASPLEFQSLDRGFDASNVIPDDYSQPYSTIGVTDDFALFDVRD